MTGDDQLVQSRALVNAEITEIMGGDGGNPRRGVSFDCWATARIRHRPLSYSTRAAGWDRRGAGPGTRFVEATRCW